MLVIRGLIQELAEVCEIFPQFSLKAGKCCFLKFPFNVVKDKNLIPMKNGSLSKKGFLGDDEKKPILSNFLKH
jgi:hypothetical protein